MQIVIEIPDEVYVEKDNQSFMNKATLDVLLAFRNWTSLLNGYKRKFEEIVVEYPPEDLCVYPEYKGRPYFSIKYEESGEHFIGYGTYNTAVLSQYLRDYFIAPTIIGADDWEDENEIQ